MTPPPDSAKTKNGVGVTQGRSCFARFGLSSAGEPVNLKQITTEKLHR